MVDDVLHLIAACYPEDVAAEFLSVLHNHADETVQVVLSTCDTVVELPPGEVSARLATLGALLDRGGAAPVTSSAMLDRLVSLVRAAGAGTVWTHCPADDRRDRAWVGWSVGVGAAGSIIRYSAGVSSHYQFVTDLAVPLPAELVRLKMAFLHEHAAALVRDDLNARHVSTKAVAACERFLCLSVPEATRLHALLHSMEEDAAIGVDPWDFRNSRYERERLQNTATWVSRHLAPSSGRLVEVGGCEGALTVLLVEAGHRVAVCEPNHRFRARLRDTVAGRAEVSADSLERLARRGFPPAAAYLLIEMLYYLSDLSILDAIPADLLFLAVTAEELRQRLTGWLAISRSWDVIETVDLVAPRVDFVCGDRVYRRKQGSVGVLCRRRVADSC